MRRLRTGIGCAWLAIAALGTGRMAEGSDQAAAVTTAATCAARAPLSAGAPITWHPGPVDDADALDQWCRGVGPPLLVQGPEPGAANVPPALDDLVVLTWNAHLAEGRLRELIDALRDGRLTGEPAQHFVLLIQELYRRGADVPAFAGSTRAAHAIRARADTSPDIRDHARSLGLSVLYVPSMRNGAELFEDRGNAILSSEPLLDAFALELPFERQRRVAVGAAVQVTAARGPMKLSVVNVHLEPLSAPSTLWVFRNPRRRQMTAVLDLLGSAAGSSGTPSIGTVLGGDFNTIQGGIDEDAYVRARAWSTSLVGENRRNTHHMGSIDHLFFRLEDGWTARSFRVEDKFGSDHHPVVGHFRLRPRTP